MNKVPIGELKHEIRDSLHLVQIMENRPQDTTLFQAKQEFFNDSPGLGILPMRIDLWMDFLCPT